MDPLFLELLAQELEARLLNARIDKIFLYHDHDLALRVRQRSGRATLMLSADSEYPTLALIDRDPDDPRGRSPILEACRARLTGARIRAIAKVQDDRVLTIDVHGTTTNGVAHRLIVEFLPRSPAIYLIEIPSQVVIAGDGVGARRISPTHPFVARSRPVDPSELHGLPRRLADEVRARASRDEVTVAVARLALETACRSAPQPCLYQLDSGVVLATAVPFISITATAQGFPDAISLAQAFYFRATVKQRESADKARLTAALIRRQRQLERVELAVRSAADSEHQGDADRAAGELLLAYQSVAVRRDGVVELPGAGPDGTSHCLPLLDDRASLVANAQAYFARYRRRQRAAAASRQRLTVVELQREHIDELLEAVQNATQADLPALNAELRNEGILDKGLAREEQPRRGRRAHVERLPGALEPRRYQAANAVILVGRSSRGNDHLTFELAAPHDFWLHSESPGSHVILKNPNRKSEPELEDLLDAAALAAWHSRSRQATRVEVMWTQRSFVARIPGAPPGRVRLRSQHAVRVAPSRARERFDLAEPTA